MKQNVELALVEMVEQLRELLVRYPDADEESRNRVQKIIDDVQSELFAE